MRTETEARTQRAEWEKALSEGRVIRCPTAMLQSFPTLEARDAALKKLRANGLKAEIVCVGCLDTQGPRHEASTRCESGRRNHCSCDTCF